jgi:putative ABC transport system permease protein
MMASGIKLWKHLIFRPIFQEKIKMLLTVIGVALGVAVFLAIRLANVSILESFKTSLEAISGRATLQISAGEAGFDEMILPVIRQIEGIQQMSPVVQTTTLLAGSQGEVLLVLGVDVLGDSAIREYTFSRQTQATDPTQDFLELLWDPQAIILTRKFAEEHGFSVDSSIKLAANEKVLTFKVKGLLEQEGTAKAQSGNIAIMDIAAAQVAFNKVGKLDRIDLIVEDSRIPEVIGRLKAKLPPNLIVERPQSRNLQVQKLLRSFQINLTVLSAIALLVGMFLIYNTLAISVVRRRKEIGTLRALGVTQGQIRLFFLLEASFIGFLGSILGLLLALLLARGALKAMTLTVSSLYVPVQIDSIVWTPELIVEGLLLGILVSMVSALIPVFEASQISPREAFQEGAYPLKKSQSYRKISLLGGVLLGLAYLTAIQRFPLNDSTGLAGQVPIYGYASALLLILGIAFLTPAFIVFFNWLMNPVISRVLKTEGKLAGNYLVQTLSRTAPAIAALMTALAMVVGVTIMVSSFRKTVEIWVNETITGDLIVAPITRFIHGAEARIREEVVQELKEVEGVAAVDSFRTLKIYYSKQVKTNQPQTSPLNSGSIADNELQTLEPFTLGAGDFQVFKEYGNMLFLKGEKHKIIEQALEKGEALVSESFSVKYGMNVGDRLTLNSPSGELQVSIAGVFYSYSTEHGLIILDRQLFKKYWKDPFVNSLIVYLKPGADLQKVREAILNRFGETHNITVITHRTLRETVLDIFDQTFAITSGLELIAIIVAVLGIANALLASILERKREIGILRSVGATQAQIMKMILYEAGLMGIISQLLGLITGIFLSFILIYVINKQSFGWTIQFFFPSTLIPKSLLIVLITSILAGYFPAKQAVQLKVVETMRYE